MKGKWRITKLPGFEPDYADMVEPAYIRFDGKGGGEFAFGCVTGGIYEAGGKEHVEFSWGGSDEMTEVDGDGWAELQPDGSLQGQICIQNGDEIDFIAKPWKTSSTAC
ncbi:MAG: hypothetical protein KGM97_10555 [Alphaproteobacteria bacterium]|nr:hypothetical protein [Alphaproteobacteria bacterium]